MGRLVCDTFATTLRNIGDSVVLAFLNFPGMTDKEFAKAVTKSKPASSRWRVFCGVLSVGPRVVSQGAKPGSTDVATGTVKWFNGTKGYGSIPPWAMHQPFIGADGDLERLGTLAHQIDCVAGIRSLPDLRAQNDYSCGIGLQ